MPNSVINWIKVTEFNLPVRRANKVGENQCSWSSYVLTLSKNYGFGFGIYDYSSESWTTYPIGMNEEDHDEVLFYAYIPLQECIDLLQQATNSTGLGVQRLIDNL